MSKPNRIVIENKGVGPIHEKQFFLDIQDAILEGYRISESNKLVDLTMRNYQGYMGRAVLELVNQVETKVETKVEPDPVEPVTDNNEQEAEVDFEELTKKAELLAYAESKGITIPEQIKQPQKIKKIIRESFKVE